MAKLHNYAVHLEWTGNTGKGTTNYKAYTRDYTVMVDGKPPILGSSDPGFLGDPVRHNPEDMFVAAISSCHMLWYLHLCSVAGIVVTAYNDPAKGQMQENPDGSGEFTSVTLCPEVAITDMARAEEATALHAKAGKMCFIARSINFPVQYEPVIVAG